MLLLSGQMGKLQHLGFQGTRVTNRSNTFAGIGHPYSIPFHSCCYWLRIWQIYSNTQAEISNPICWSENQNHLCGKLKEKHYSRKKMRKALASSMANSLRACWQHTEQYRKLSIVAFSHMHTLRRGGSIRLKMLIPNCRIDSLPKALRHTGSDLVGDLLLSV